MAIVGGFMKKKAAAAHLQKPIFIDSRANSALITIRILIRSPNTNFLTLTGFCRICGPSVRVKISRSLLLPVSA